MYLSRCPRFFILTDCRPGDVKDFVKKIKQEDSRIAFKKQKLEKMAKARAAAAASVNLSAVTPVIIVSSDSTQVETSGVRSEAPSAPPGVPRSVPAAVSPLHPSLPPKPGAPSKAVDHLKPTVPPAPAPTTNATPARVSTPVPAVDIEIAKYEEVNSFFCKR